MAVRRRPGGNDHAADDADTGGRAVDRGGGFEELAQALGADLSAPEYLDAIANFETVEADLKAAIAEKPGLNVLVIAPDLAQVYVATPDWMVDLNYFRSLGLDLVTHTTDNFLDLLSWEQINRYPADLILVDARNVQLQADELAVEVPTWNALPAVQAGQVGAWYAAAPFSRKRLIPIMQELTELIRRCRANVD